MSENIHQLFPRIILDIHVDPSRGVILDIFPKTVLLHPQTAINLAVELLDVVESYWGSEKLNVRRRPRKRFFRLSLKASVTRQGMCLMHVDARKVLLIPEDAVKLAYWLIETFQFMPNRPRFYTITDFLGTISQYIKGWRNK